MRSLAWLEALAPHAVRLAQSSIPGLVQADPELVTATTYRVGPILACFARQQLDAPAWSALQSVARMRGVEAAFTALFKGETVNRSEGRPALHAALRSDPETTSAARAARDQACKARLAMATLVEQLRATAVTDLIHVGIGGSELGPRLVLEALREFDDHRFRIHFLSSADGHASEHLLRSLDPARTAVVLVSKSFGTRETRANGARLQAWLGTRENLYAVTADADAAIRFGVSCERILPLWDWVGGRYSIWSSVGFTVAASLGMAVFERLLAGAALMDTHVRSAPLAENLAVAHGLVAVWNRSLMGHTGHVIAPYDIRLSGLPAYLQQLLMESLGKSADQDGRPVAYATGALIWGSNGPDAQHSYFQALHQGTDVVPVDFVGVVRPDHDWCQAQDILLANLLAQSEALANGAPSQDPHRSHPGNRPSTVLLLDELSPEALGALLALYEHSVYVQATLWGINPFDQWGVELGKRLADSLLPALSDTTTKATDPVTAAMIDQIRQLQKPHS